MTRTIVITGASDGIGAAAARQLHAAGEEVVVVGRDRSKTERVADELGVDRHVADFAVLDEVRGLAEALRARHARIDVLANNAGGVFDTRRTTVDGHELTFQVNHLAGFLLTALLSDRLRGADGRAGASVIQTSSAAAQRFSRFDIDDLDARRRYSKTTAYGNAKLANILFTVELQRRLGNDGVSAAAFHPGVIASGFASNSRGPWRWLYTNPLTRRLLTPVDVGGARLAWLAHGTPGVDWTPGSYYAENRVADTHRLASDRRLAAQLWERSSAMVGLPAGWERSEGRADGDTAR